MKVYQYPAKYNVGDTLTLPLLEGLFPGTVFERVKENESGKLLGIGSIMTKIKPGDTVWGSGVMRHTDKFPQAPQVNFRAVRGVMSRDIIVKSGGTCPEVYGDPALLLPLIYKPEIEQTNDIGVVPHYVDREIVGNYFKEVPIIGVNQNWKAFIDQILSCKKIISSSLHGIVIAEAYGIQAEWVVMSNKVLGNGFKFEDYLTGTGRKARGPSEFPAITNIKEIRDGLLTAIKSAIIEV